MARSAPNGFYDNGLVGWIQNRVTRMVICSDEPANYAAVAGVALADVAIDSSDITVQAGAVSGRRATVAAQSEIEIDMSGDADHVALVNDNDSELLYVTTATQQPLTQGGTVSTNAWDIEIRAPAEP